MTILPIPFSGIDYDSEKGTLEARSPDMQNVRLTLKKGIETVTGYSKWNSNQLDSGATITGIFDYQKKSGSQKIVVCNSAGKIYYGAAGAGAYTSIKTGLTASVLWYSFAILNDKMLATNGTDPVQVWNGSDAATRPIQSRGWLTIASIGTARQYLTGFAFNNYGYVAGGASGATTYATVEQYNDSTNVWTAKTSLNTARSEAAGFAMTYGYVSGGLNNTPAVTNSTEQYNDIANTWTAKANLTVAKSACAAFVLNKYAYVCGGYAVAGTSLGTVYQYDEGSNVWTAKTSMVVRRDYLACFATSTYGYAADGLTDTVSGNTAERYNDISNTWAAIATTNYSNASLCGFGVSNNGYIAGGQSFSTVTEKYIEVSDVWVKTSSLNTGRLGLAGFALNNYGYAVGGTTGAVSAVAERFSDYDTPPIVKYIVSHKERMFGAYNPTYPSRIFWTDLSNLENWLLNAFQDINPDDGDEIRGVTKYMDSIYIHKKFRMYRFYGSDFEPGVGDYGIEYQEGVPGTPSGRSIVIANNRMYYVSYDGFIEYNGSYPKYFGIGRVDKYLRGSLSSYIQNCVGAHLPKYNEIWWAFTKTGTTNDVVIVYNYALDEFYGPYTIPTASMAVIEDKTNNVKTLLTGGYTGYVWQQDSGNNFDGSAIDAYYKTDWFTFGDDWNTKAFRRLYVNVKKTGNWNLLIDPYVDYSATSLGQKTVSMLNTLVEQYNRVDLASKPGRALQLKFANATLNQYFSIMKVGLEVEISDEGRKEVR